MSRLLGKHKGGESHEEPWLVSYADMMTLLFGFFVILFSLSQMDENKFTSVGKQLAEAFKGQVDKNETEVGMIMEARQIRALQMMIAMLNLGDMEKVVESVERRLEDSKSMEQARDNLMKDLKADKGKLDELKLSVAEKDDEVEIAVPDTMLFASGTANLVPGARESLKKIATYLTRVQDLTGLEVVGHTDSLAPSKTSMYPSNWALSSARAGAVAEELLKHGLSAKRFTVRGMASLQPLFPERRGDGSLISENLAKNRRVAIRVHKIHAAAGGVSAPAPGGPSGPK